MGFSQGAAMALHVAHRYPQPLLGVGVMSAISYLQIDLKREAADANEDTPFRFTTVQETHSGSGR